MGSITTRITYNICIKDELVVYVPTLRRYIRDNGPTARSYSHLRTNDVLARVISVIARYTDERLIKPKFQTGVSELRGDRSI